MSTERWTHAKGELGVDGCARRIGKMAVLIGSHAIADRGRRLLPAAAQRAVQLHQREQLVPSGLSQSQFGVEKIAIGIQGVQ